MKKGLRRWLTCWGRHDYSKTKPITVSGFGYTEYQIYFCWLCEKPKFIQTHSNFVV